jgi:hypothetical protein
MVIATELEAAVSLELLVVLPDETSTQVSK